MLSSTAGRLGACWKPRHVCCACCPFCRPTANGPAPNWPNASASPRAPYGGTSTGCVNSATRSTPAPVRAAAISSAQVPNCRHCCSTTTRRSRSPSGCAQPQARASRASARPRYGPSPNWSRSCRTGCAAGSARSTPSPCPCSARPKGSSTRPYSPSSPTPAGTASGCASSTATTAAARLAGPSSRTGWCAPNAAGISSRGTWTARTGVPSGRTGSHRSRRTARGSRRAPRRPRTSPPMSPGACPHGRTRPRPSSGCTPPPSGPHRRSARPTGCWSRVDDTRCLLRTGAASLDVLVIHIMLMGVDFEVVEPQELTEHITAIRDRLSRALAPAG